MKIKTTILAFLTLFIGLQSLQAKESICIDGEDASMIMTTDDNSIIVSAACRIYTINMTTYQATLLTVSPYVAEINSLAVDATTGWIFYVSNQASTYNWTVYGYNVHSNTHKSFGDIRSYFTETGHAYSSRGLGSGGATFYNGKLYFAMEYPSRCHSYRTSSGEVVVKDELQRELDGVKLRSGSLVNTEFETSTRRSGYDTNLTERSSVSGNAEENNLRDYVSETAIANTNSLSGATSRATSSRSYNYSNYLYLLEVCFDNLSDNSGDSAIISNAGPKYDTYGYSSFLYRGELGDIGVSDSGEIYAVTSYQIQHFDFNTNTFCWANNEDVYAQIAKDKNSNFQLLKNTNECVHDHDSCTYYCTRNSYVQSYTQPDELQTYNNIQLGSLNMIHGLDPADVGRITDAADYLSIEEEVEVSYNIEGNVFDDDNENGTQDSTEGNLENIVITLYADSNNNGVLDDEDVELGSTNSDENGDYSFANVNEEDVLVVVSVPEDNAVNTYTLTTDEVIVITSTTDDVTGVDFGINEVAIEYYSISGLVWDDNSRDGIQDPMEAILEDVVVNLYQDTNGDGNIDAGDVLLDSFTTTDLNPNYEFTNIQAGMVIIEAVKPADNPPFLFFFETYDLDSGTTAPDGIYAVDLNTSLTNVDFGIDKLLGNSRLTETEDKKEETPEAEETEVRDSEDTVQVITENSENLDADAVELFNGIKLYPNPSTDYIMVKSNLLDENTVVKVYSITGKLLMTKDYSEESSMNEVRIELNQLSAGLYLAKIITKGNKTVVKRFVKQ